MDRLEDESEGSFLQSISRIPFPLNVWTYKLLDDSLDELGEVESLVWLALEDVFAEDSDTFGIGVGVELVTSLDENVLEFLVWAYQ